jgi:hypothetical protein
MAREWNDLVNWPVWAHQLKKGEALAIQEKWRFSIQNKFSVILTDSLSSRIPDAQVSLETPQGRLIMESRTDNTGLCELFIPIGIKPESLRLKIVYADQVFYTGDLHRQPGTIEKQLNIRRKIAFQQDIMFVVHTSEAINPQIQYLQAGLSTLLNQVKDSSSLIPTRVGNVFYGEKAGSAVSYVSSLTDDLTKASKLIKEQPITQTQSLPTVDIALEEAVYKQPWAKEAISRLLFLVLDSQPDYNPAVVERLARVTREAARQGIRIVPVVAGSVNKETEFLLRSLAIRTHGTYIFTSTHESRSATNTPESGIKAYPAEELMILLERLLLQYREIR